MPDTAVLGSVCPATKPRGDGFQAEAAEPTLKELKEAEKAAKKAAAKEKREAKRLAREGD